MMSFFQNFHFIRPLWLLLLIIPALFYYKYFKGVKNKSSWENVVDKNLLNFLLLKGSSKNRKTLGYMAFTVFILAIIAIAGPTWNKKEVPNMLPENPIIIVLNLSSDMNATDLSPSRLTRAKYKISDLLKSLKSVQAGMIVYTDEPFLVSPITEDTNIIINMLSSIDSSIMPSNGDRLDRAINLAAKSLQNGGYKSGNIIFFTSDVGQKFDMALNEAKKLKNLNYDLSIINVSAEKNEKLEMISKNGNGEYVAVSINDNDIKLINNKINKDFSKFLKTSENISMVWEEYGYWLSIIILVVSLYFFRKGILIVTFIISIATPTKASFFMNNNEEGLVFFKNKEFEKASQTFKDSRWLGSSYYRLEDYEKAYNEFTKHKDKTSLYNQGNALAKLGKIEDAIKKYEAVIEQDPTHEDAKFNLEYLKQQQNQQQNNPSNDQGEKDNQEEQEQQNSSSEQNQEQNPENDQEQNSQDSGDEKDKQQNQDFQTQDSENKDPKDPQENSSPQYKEKNESGEKNEEQYVAQQGQRGAEDWDEEAQAVEQKYREIPENPGGLLRAFIEKEHIKRRYKD